MKQLKRDVDLENNPAIIQITTVAIEKNIPDLLNYPPFIQS